MVPCSGTCCTRPSTIVTQIRPSGGSIHHCSAHGPNYRLVLRARGATGKERPLLWTAGARGDSGHIGLLALKSWMPHTMSWLLTLSPSPPSSLLTHAGAREKLEKQGLHVNYSLLGLVEPCIDGASLSQLLRVVMSSFPLPPWHLSQDPGNISDSATGPISMHIPTRADEESMMSSQPYVRLYSGPCRKGRACSAGRCFSLLPHTHTHKHTWTRECPYRPKRDLALDSTNFVAVSCFSCATTPSSLS